MTMTMKRRDSKLRNRKKPSSPKLRLRRSRKRLKLVKKALLRVTQMQTTECARGA